MLMKRTVFVLIFLFSILMLATGQDPRYLDSREGLSGITPGNGLDRKVTVKIIYDNTAISEGLIPDWGYSALITGLGKTILFDTGTKPEVFVSNFRKMNLDASGIDYLVLSHEHGDHTEGIPGLVTMARNIPVIIPHSFSQQFKSRMLNYEMEPILVNEPALICEDLYTSGEFPDPTPEQALVLNTTKGLVVMTGCSHPGIIKMLKEIKSRFRKDIYMVFGGFHLLQKSDEEMKSIIYEMRQIGVVKCGATHCTGDHQIDLFREAFGINFVELGAGNSIVID